MAATPPPPTASPLQAPAPPPPLSAFPAFPAAPSGVVAREHPRWTRIGPLQRCLQRASDVRPRAAPGSETSCIVADPGWGKRSAPPPLSPCSACPSRTSPPPCATRPANPLPDAPSLGRRAFLVYVPASRIVRICVPTSQLARASMRPRRAHFPRVRPPVFEIGPRIRIRDPHPKRFDSDLARRRNGLR